MKRLLVLILALGIVPTAVGEITLQVCEADGETPFDCNDAIMVGTELTLIVSSDSNDYWSGGLFIAGQDRALGTLSGRDLDPNARDYTDSHYEAAGDFAIVTAWKDSSIWGFDLYTFYPVDGNSVDSNTVAGDWFVIDYQADEVGDCNVGFYDYGISWDAPNYFLSFSHSPTRDLNSDDVVDFIDFAIFASQWNANDCNDPNSCNGVDLDGNGDVDYNDLGLFVEYWLWPALPSEPGEPREPGEPGEPREPGEPGELNTPEDPTYSIVDANGLNEITIDVNDSITLYVDIATADSNVKTYLFDIEVTISDPNLGSIDNRAYNPNDPPGPGTARILTGQRMPDFDYWKPGLQQEEGIDLSGANMFLPLSDGHLASFVFTCEGEGDVTLELINWLCEDTSKLESILIHQNDLNSP